MNQMPVSTVVETVYSVGQALQAAARIKYPVKCRIMSNGTPTDWRCTQPGDLSSLLTSLVKFRDGFDAAEIYSA
jgi:hypothetical protein